MDDLTGKEEALEVLMNKDTFIENPEDEPKDKSEFLKIEPKKM